MKPKYRIGDRIVSRNMDMLITKTWTEYSNFNYYRIVVTWLNSNSKKDNIVFCDDDIDKAIKEGRWKLVRPYDLPEDLFEI